MNWLNKLFKKKTKLEKLNDIYDSLMEESYRLSKVNRTKSDKKVFEANQIMLEIEELENTLYDNDRNIS